MNKMIFCVQFIHYYHFINKTFKTNDIKFKCTINNLIVTLSTLVIICSNSSSSHNILYKRKREGES